MNSINISLDNIQTSLEKIAVPEVTGQSKWRLDIKNVFSKLAGTYQNKESILSSTIKEYFAALSQYEKIPVIFNGSVQISEQQKAVYDRFIHLKRSFKPLLTSSNSPLLKHKWHEISSKVAALGYRLEGENGGLDVGPVDEVLFKGLEKSAIEWKEGLDMMVIKELSPNQLEKLKVASTYHKFAKHLLLDKSLRERFFIWALRDNNGVDQFVQFPSTCSRIKTAFLSARLGRFGGTMFQIEKKPCAESEGKSTEKIISLPFWIGHRIEQVSILDESREVELTGWKLTIKQAIDIFAKKNDEVGNLEFFGTQGITNWNSHQLGSWNPETGKFDTIDVTAEKWWEQLPVLEEITKETLEERYGVKLEAGEWLACAKSSRTTADLDLDARHGYLEISIPTPDGNYRVYPFGNFAAVFPNGIVQLLRFLVATVVAKIAYPDENFFYSQRQLASFPIKVVDVEGKKIMKQIQIDVIKARHGYMIFQFGGQNCAFWAQKILHAVIDALPNFFKMPVIESNPNNLFLKGLFKMFRATPQRMQNKVIGIVEEVLGASKGLKVYDAGKLAFVAHKGSPVYNEQSIYQPGFLHKQIEENQIDGIITYGHD